MDDRIWINLKHCQSDDVDATTSIRILSYQLLTRNDLHSIRHADIEFNILQLALEKEIFAYEADIIGLQNIDDFDKWRQLLM
jgi:hypothetical protein